MFIEETIKGKYVTLKSANIEDAEFSLELRQNPALTKYLPKLDVTIEQQKNWILDQRNKNDDYFFVVINNKNERIGALGIYAIQDKSAETGRLAIVGNPFENLEAQYLSFVFAFEVLKLESTHCFIYKDNSKAIRLSEFFGTSFSSLEKDEKGNFGYRGLLTKNSFKRTEPAVKRFLHLS